MNNNFKTGFIAIVGRPNAGKSTLVNRLVREKVSIVSWCPQTTRNRIMGILNGDNYQAVFIDTPGIHESKNKLSNYMAKSINTSLQDVDVILYLIDGTKFITDVDRNFIEKLNAKAPLIIALNKVDKASKERYVETLSKLNEFKRAKSIYSISATRGDGVDDMLKEIITHMPSGQRMFPEDMYTDRTLRFMVQETIREKALFNLNEEIPYGIGIIINKFNKREHKDIIDIDADIVCERQQHKAIIIGKQGSMLKKIGQSAREDIEKIIGKKVYLKLYVKVSKDWRDNKGLLEELGYSEKTL